MSANATARIHALGARATPARIAVLDLLLGAEQALSHHEVEAALASHGFDRVTLYRVLDWLVSVDLAHRIIENDRVFRFSISSPATAHHPAHAHFRCEDCGKVFCLENVPVTPPQLPDGFAGHHVDLRISGECALCAKARHPESTS
jgi:Fur family transcriptional regulator, ferric uptake regulator